MKALVFCCLYGALFLGAYTAAKVNQARRRAANAKRKAR